MEDAHLKLLYEEQEEARQQLMKEQELALTAIMEQDRRLAAEKQEDQEVGRRREQLMVSLSLADRDRGQTEMKAAAQRLPAEPSPTEDHIQVRYHSQGPYIYLDLRRVPPFAWPDCNMLGGGKTCYGK